MVTPAWLQLQQGKKPFQWGFPLYPGDPWWGSGARPGRSISTFPHNCLRGLWLMNEQDWGNLCLALAAAR